MKNQSLIISGILVCCGLAGLVWGGVQISQFSFRLNRSQAVEQKAVVLAYQIAESYKASLRRQNEILEPSEPVGHSQSRSLASVSDDSTSHYVSHFLPKGQIGKDPWGRSYQYEIKSLPNGLQISVWSAGPDGIFQIQSDFAASHIKSDDLGKVIQLSENFSFQ